MIRRTAQQIAALEAELRARDEAIAEAQRHNANLDAEIARLREEVARARAANAERPDTHDTTRRRPATGSSTSYSANPAGA